jgi:regulation of enolase protein 1 (concanavalin A-like superfamily)
MKCLISLCLLLLASATIGAEEVLFHEDFTNALDGHWAWIREHREAWRTTARGLEVRIEPGNMWGPANDARNVLVRPAPDVTQGEIEISVNVENQPTEQYEQVDLVWYYDDSHMVKIGLELVDGKLSIVMGREQADKTRTISITPIKPDSVRLKLLVKGDQIRGQFQIPGSDKWQDAGHCDSPAPANGKPKVSLQFYQGPANAEHWARINDFQIGKANSSKTQ